MHGGGGGGDGDGGGGDGGGGLGDGGGGDGEGGGTGQAVWQTYLFFSVQSSSSHLPYFQLPNKQSPELLGSPVAKCQLVYDSGVLDGLHTHVPSDAASVPPIHTSLRAAAVSSNAFCSASCTLASCRPAAWQAASASAHGRASLMSV